MHHYVESAQSKVQYVVQGLIDQASCIISLYQQTYANKTVTFLHVSRANLDYSSPEVFESPILN